MSKESMYEVITNTFFWPVFGVSSLIFSARL